MKSINYELQEHALFSSQWSLLYCLKKNGSMTQKEMAEYLHVESPTITRTLLKLEESGYIKRQSGIDKRERVVSLTEKALACFPAVDESVRRHERNMLCRLSAGEKQQLARLLEKIDYSEERR
ncbi:MarR family winged helix-turn-helix transcriptional regulator [Sinobaca sp. H24]|uniref:MarR family winged helix-turn-helix transcriptional regulator n=1 Tax=Sinobaca sp. H24 TaxID=2923376 RepID=UPI002079B12E|nr:MarR family transcriptional regulator [Sinobaca sp. H24]